MKRIRDHFWTWLFGVPVTAAFIFMLNQCAGTPGTVPDPSGKLPEIDHPGLVEDRYYTYKGSYTYRYKGGGEKELDSLRNESVKRLIEEKIHHGSNTELTWFSGDDFKQLLQDVGNVYGALLLKSNPVNVYFVLSGKHDDSYDEKKHLYTYIPVLLVPKERYMRYPKNIGDPLSNYLDELYLKEIHELNDKDSVEVVLTGVELDRDKFHLSAKDNSEIVKILKYSPKSVGLFIRELINGHNGLIVDNFSSGKYEMEGKMEAALIAFVKNFMNERPKGYNYDIYCYGYADEKPINSMVVYYGEADFAKGIGQSILLDNLHKPKQAYNIKNNNDLSIARACAGARIIKQSVLSEDNSGSKNPRINIYYAGRGVMNTKNYDQARQIKIIVSKK